MAIEIPGHGLVLGCSLFKLLHRAKIYYKAMERTKHYKPKRISKGAVLASVAKDKEVRKENLKKTLKDKFGQKKASKYPQVNPNMEQFFCLPKFIGVNDFKMLTKHEIALYPVMCALADFRLNNWFHVSMEDLIILTGIKSSSINSAAEDLTHRTLVDNGKEIHFLEREKVNRGSTHPYRYKVGFVRAEMMDHWSNKLTFYTSIIKSGLWARLSLRAKVLYITLRSFSKYDQEIYNSIEDIDPENYGDIRDNYRYRWEICKMNISDLCKAGHIQRSNINPVLEDLIACHLIERLDSYFIVYLQPDIS